MPRSRRNRRSVSKRFRTRQKLKLETLEKRFALDADSPSISLLTNGFGPGAMANSGAPVSFFLSQQNQVPFSGSADTEAGIVITSLNLQGGKLWYSTTSGSVWSEIESAGPTSGTVLIDDGSTHLHYEPPAEFSGQVEDVFSFKAYSFAPDVVSGSTQFDATMGSTWQSVGSYSMPNTMEEVYTNSEDGGKLSLFDNGTRAAAIHTGGLEILDISNPAAIQRVGILPSDPTHPAVFFSDVHIAGDESTIFINPTELSTNKSFIVDISDQSSPQLLPSDEWHDEGQFAWTVTSNSDGSLVVVGATGGAEDSGRSNIFLFNTTDRTNHQLIGSLNLAIPVSDEPTYPGDIPVGSDLWAQSITMSPDENTLYVSCYSEFHPQNSIPLFFVVDITDKTQPQLVAEITKSGFTAEILDSPKLCLSPDGNTLYVAGNAGSYDENSGGFLAAFDVTVPSSPSQVWKHAVDTGGGVANEIIHEPNTNSVYVAYDGGVHSFEVDADGVINHELVSSPGLTSGVALSTDGQTAYVMGQDSLSVYATSQGTSVDVTLAGGETGDNNWHPVLDTSADVRLPNVVTDAESPPEILQARPNAVIGTPVSQLIDRDGPLSNYADPDFADETYGVAITRTNMAGGTLWFSIDGGSSWADVGVVSDSSARVLEANDDTRLYYQPPAGTIGNIYDAFSYKAWDTSGGYQNGDAGVDTSHTAGLGEDLVSNVEISNSLNAVMSANNFLYAPTNLSQTITIYEITNNEGATPRGVVSFSETGWGIADLIEIQGGARLLAMTGQANLYAFDISNPDSPQELFANHQLSILDNTGTSTPVTLWTIAPSVLSDTFFGITTDRKFCVIKYRAEDFLPYIHSYVEIPPSFSLNTGQTDGLLKTHSLIPHPDGKSVFLAAENNIAAIDVSVYESPTITDTLQFNIGDVTKPIVSDDGNTLSLLVKKTDSEAVFTNIDIRDRTNLLITGSVEVPNRNNNFLFEGKDGAMWSVSQAHINLINNQNLFQPFVATVYPHALFQGETNFYNQSTLFGNTNFIGVTTYNGMMGSSSGAVYSPNFKASFSNEAEVVRVRITQNSPSVFEGDTSGVLNVGRAAYGFLACSDADGLQQGILSVAVDGAKGDASILPAGNGGWQWYYHAGPLFDGDDSFTVTLIDDLGVETQQTITITGEPSQTVGPLTNMAVHQNQSGSVVSYSVPAVGLQGQPLNGGFARVVATSSNPGLVPNPTVVYSSPDVPSVISFVPSAGESGSTTLSIQVETGGADDDLTTVGDNAFATHQVEVTVLEVISSQGSTVLAKDASESLYVNAQPVTYNQQHVPQAFLGSDVTGVELSDEGNALLLRHSASQDDGPTHRLITDNAFRINGIFNSLQNESPRVLDISGREVSKNVNIVAVAGAYEINGVRNPTIVMRRGQTYTVNVNAPSDPIWLQTTGNGFDYASGYRNSFSPNGETSGEYEWVVPADAPDELFYQGWIQPEMFGKIIVVD